MIHRDSLACLKYWDLCSSVSLDAAVALWCGVEPGELASLGFSTSCMDAKREALVQALLDHRLEFEDRPVPKSNGSGMWYGAGLQELIEKGGVRIKKASLRRWFFELPFEDRPAFLFDEMRQEDQLPDGGDVAEMNSLRALAVMAWILSDNRPALRISGRPNASEIGKIVEPLAKKAFGEDTRGFASFNKKLSKALVLLNQDTQAELPWARD